ncbi:abscisic acid and environmental stress-inducible protein-like [Asparagus officinalis]|uniref:abscisic acid and environmental stress-inducible protein-like n=1 Tax=Asparagus officinalis TaxID=4686 RepID=UPI00098E1370|nr:abscisic acid and environmental stress-inducible protein-like [Asparagus officinalis]
MASRALLVIMGVLLVAYLVLFMEAATASREMTEKPVAEDHFSDPSGGYPGGGGGYPGGEPGKGGGYPGGGYPGGGGGNPGGGGYPGGGGGNPGGGGYPGGGGGNPGGGGYPGGGGGNPGGGGYPGGGGGNPGGGGYPGGGGGNPGGGGYPVFGVLPNRRCRLIYLLIRELELEDDDIFRSEQGVEQALGEKKPEGMKDGEWSSIQKRAIVFEDCEHNVGGHHVNEVVTKTCGWQEDVRVWPTTSSSLL